MTEIQAARKVALAATEWLANGLGSDERDNALFERFQQSVEDWKQALVTQDVKERSGFGKFGGGANREAIRAMVRMKQSDSFQGV